MEIKSLSSNYYPVEFSYFAKEDLETILSWLSTKKGSSFRIYKRVLVDFFKHNPRRKLSDFNSNSLIIFLKVKEKKGLQQESLRNVKFVLSSLFSYAMKSGHIQRNPLSLVPTPQAPDRTFSKILSKEEIQRMLQESDSTRDSLIIEFLYFSLFRVSELCSLKVGDFVADSFGGASCTVIGKGGKTRTVKIPSKIFSKLNYFWSESGKSQFDFAFSSQKSEKISASQVYRIISVIAKKSKLNRPVSPHWLRHSGAAHAVKAGAPIDVLRKDLGHSSIKVTSKYTDLFPTQAVSDFLEL